MLEATLASIAEASAALRQPLAGSPTPGSGVRRFVEATAEMMIALGYTFGCPVAPITFDAHGEQAALAELCRAAFDELTGVMRAAFEAAGMAPERREPVADG